VLARISDETLYTLNGIELLCIIYLAIALSQLRERIARLEGKYAQREHDDEGGTHE
jgi:hypothetical protein